MRGNERGIGKMAQALLFDLDGTLLPMDTEEFVMHYLANFASVIKEHLDPELFKQALLKGTGAMISNLDPHKTNEQVFSDVFITLTKVDKESFWPLLHRFYEEDFPYLEKYTQPTPWAKKVVEEACNQNYRLVIATNPVFPERAIKERLKWAGVAQFPFEVITAYENSYFTKPHLEYYQMIIERLGLPASECIMIGNDVQEDMCASQLGMKTYLVEDCLIDKGEPHYQIDGRGTLAELYQQLAQRAGLFAN